MNITIHLNGQTLERNILPGTTLFDFLRNEGCMSLKCGCDTANCGLCTVLLEGKSVLSCSVLAARANGKHVRTLEGLQQEAEEFGAYLAGEGGDQCGFCNPGFIMNVIAMCGELKNPTEADVKTYLAGNLCRCTGFASQTRAILRYLKDKEAQRDVQR